MCVEVPARVSFWAQRCWSMASRLLLRRRPPLILDTQRGIQDGKGGLVLQTAPLSSEPIVEPAGMRPAGQAPNTSVPLFVAPYINVPAWGGQPVNQPRLAPRPQP